MKIGFHKSAFAALMLVGIACAVPKDTINLLPAYEEAQGFKLMFDSTANSFRNNFVNYAQNGTTTTTLNAGWTMDTTFTDPDRPGTFFRAIKTTAAITDMRTKTMYRDIDLRWEYRNNGNEGMIYRFDLSQGNSWGTGIEMGIDDNSNQRGWLTSGAAYEVYAPSPQPYFAFNTGKWNTMRLVVKADSVEHWLNGVRVVAFKYWSQSFRDSVAKSKWATSARFCQTANNNKTYIPLGYWGFQADHGGTWQIRKLRVLHDTIGSPDRVKFGPVDMSGTTPVLGASRIVAQYRIEQTSQGLRVFSDDPAATLRTVEILGIDGRRVRLVRPHAENGQWTVPTGALRKGVYILRLATSTETRLIKTLIH